MNRTRAIALLTVGIACLIIAAIMLADTANAAGKRWVPCEYEDSIGCVWDARHMGNGVGDSFFANRSGVHYISHARAHSMLNR